MNFGNQPAKETKMKHKVEIIMTFIFLTLACISFGFWMDSIGAGTFLFWTTWFYLSITKPGG